MTESQDVLAEAIGSVELGFWRETPIEDPDGVHGIEARFDVRAFAEAITAALTVRGYALVRTPETLDALTAAIETFLGTPRPTIGMDNAIAAVKEWEMAVQRLRIAYGVSQGHVEPCPVPSSVTGQPCLLPVGHPQDSADRFHRYATPSPTPPEGLRAALLGLLDDTEHREHDCGDVDCPVSRARAALAASPAPDPGAGLREADIVGLIDSVVSQRVFPNDRLTTKELAVFQITCGFVKRRLVAALAPSAEPPETSGDGR